MVADFDQQDFDQEVQMHLRRLKLRGLLAYEACIVVGLGFMWLIVLTQPLWRATVWLFVLSHVLFGWYAFRAYRQWKRG